MSRLRSAVAALPLLLGGCAVQPSGVVHSGEPPTGVAPGVTLYFVDDGRLQPDLRETGRLGTVAEALALLLTGPGQSGLRTEITSGEVTRVWVTQTPELIDLTTPLTIGDVTPLGIDQIVCTTLGVHVQSGGSTGTTVRVGFVQPTPESDRRRTCPLIG